MLIYTPIPIEVVLEGVQQERLYKEIQVEGVKLLVEDLESGQARIMQLLSTNPNDYLNPKYSPGNILSYEEPSITIK